MKNTVLAATATLALLASPLLAQDRDIDDERVVVIEKAGTGEKQRKVRVIRLDERRTTEADIDAVEEVEVRIVRMGEDADLSVEELRAIAEREIADGEMVVFSGEEMQCEKAAGGDVRLKVCTSDGAQSTLRALREARAEIAGESGLSADQRSRALSAIDRSIAELEAAQD